MDLSRNMILAILIVAIALGVFYMLDPTFGGLLGAKEGFENNMIIDTTGPQSMNGEMAGAFANAGENDEAAVMNNEYNESEGFENVSPMAPGAKKGAEPAPAAHEMSAGKMATEGFENLSPSAMPFAAAEKPANCYPKNQLAPQELLPNDPNSKWAQVNPMGAGDIAGKNFLNAGANIGVNTVGQSLRNASHDLRSEPPNPQVIVSPWNMTTIESDLSRRPLEIA
jgi:hypothetical protein